MKLYLILPLIAASSFVFVTGCSGNSKRLKTTTDAKVVLTDTNIQLGTSSNSFPIRLDFLIKELGEPDETHELINTIRVWNRLGIYCYTSPESDFVSDLVFTFVVESYDFSPTEPFEGSLKIGDVIVTRETVGTSLPALGFEEKPADSIPGFSKKIGAHSVIINTEDAKATSVSISLPTKP